MRDLMQKIYKFIGEDVNKIEEEINYVEDKVLPLYDTNIGGHGRDHILTVIMRSFEIKKEFDLSLKNKLILIIAAYHDIGYKKDPDNHEQVSSEMFLADKEIQKFLEPDEVQIVAEAIVDHRASLEYEARSEYGKLVSSADRETSVENMLKRSFLYQADKHADENPTIEQVIEYSFKKLTKKFGKDGYAKMYFPDKKYTEYLKEMQELLENKDKFIAREMKFAPLLSK